MTEERRYEEREIAEIFEAAAAPATARGAQGLTLSELQAIGGEVGIAPERIAAAAAGLARRPVQAPRRTSLGVPVSTGRVLELPRALTDREWGLLLGEVRATFGAAGREVVQGDTRQWRNSNLHVFVEPSATGYRLRMGTLKGDASAVNGIGLGGIVMGAVTAGSTLTGADPASGLAGALALAALGVGALAFNAVRLPRWVRERDAQMDYLVERTREIVNATPGNE